MNDSVNLSSVVTDSIVTPPGADPGLTLIVGVLIFVGILIGLLAYRFYVWLDPKSRGSKFTKLRQELEEANNLIGPLKYELSQARESGAQELVRLKQDVARLSGMLDEEVRVVDGFSPLLQRLDEKIRGIEDGKSEINELRQAIAEMSIVKPALPQKKRDDEDIPSEFR